MPKTKSQPWKDSELEHAAGELAKEYPNVSMRLIMLVVLAAKEATPPSEGRVRLLAVARRNLSR